MKKYLLICFINFNKATEKEKESSNISNNNQINFDSLSDQEKFQTIISNMQQIYRFSQHNQKNIEALAENLRINNINYSNLNNSYKILGNNFNFLKYCIGALFILIIFLYFKK